MPYNGYNWYIFLSKKLHLICKLLEVTYITTKVIKDIRAIIQMYYIELSMDNLYDRKDYVIFLDEYKS